MEHPLREQAAELVQLLCRKDMAASTIKLKIRWPDFTAPIRQQTLP